MTGGEAQRCAEVLAKQGLTQISWYECLGCGRKIEEEETRMCAPGRHWRRNDIGTWKELVPRLVECGPVIKVVHS